MSKFFTIEMANFESLDFITVKSNALNKRADITVFNPEKNKKTTQSIPLVILLHGVYGSHWAWTVKGKVHQTLQQLMNSNQIRPMVIAMPSDGLFGDGSAYLPHKQVNYEKWIVEDVINVMKEQYPQIDKSSPVFIAGLSMGGFGAMRLGAKYPTLFNAISGLSSITHFNQMEQFVSNFQELKNEAIIHDGVLEWFIKNKTQLPPFRFDCGKLDILIEHNRLLHIELGNHNIHHIYQEFEGEHSWEYWTKHIKDTLLFFNGLV